MNALLEPKFCILEKPWIVFSLASLQAKESPSDSFCVFMTVWEWDEMQKLEIVLVVYLKNYLKHLCICEKQWPWGLSLVDLPWYLSCLLAYFIFAT